MTVLVNPFILAVPDEPPPTGELTELETVAAAFSATNAPTVTFTGPFEENDLILIFSSTDTNAAINGSYNTSYATIVGGALILPVNTSVSVCCQYHWVTSAEESGSTVTFGQTLYAATEAGTVYGVALRGADLTTPIDLFNSAFGATQPFTLSGLADTITDGCLVYSILGVDLIPTLDAPTNSWEVIHANVGTGHVGGLYGRPAPAVNGVAVPAGSVGASGNDDFANLTVAIRPA